MRCLAQRSHSVNVREMNLPTQFRATLALLLDLAVMKELVDKPIRKRSCSLIRVAVSPALFSTGQ